MMELRASKIKDYIRSALKDKRLQDAVMRATETALHKRAERVADIPEWESLRQLAHSAKRRVIEHLDEYLVTFESACRSNGITVHWARDASQAREVVAQIARENGVRTIVKSKSLTTEEIHVNQFLVRQGIETIETDLGEYIVQLLGQIPSHLTSPALHLTRKDVGRVFQEKLGVAYTEDPQELMAIARSKLREKFLAAGMGISGCNFAIADSGCIVVVENEANAHMCMELPKIHVALIGIEKLIPSFDDLPVFLKLLAPSATGQKQSVYVNIVGSAQHRISGTGPEQVHVILLDNGRSRILADPQLRETLFCIRCAACLNVCPIYQQVGGHAYGWVYMGPIGVTLIPQYLGEHEGRYAPFVSSLCGACRQICPLKIDIPHHLLKLRSKVVNAGESANIERLGIRLWAFLARHPLLYRLATWFPGRLQKIYPSPFPVPGWSGERSLGRFDGKGFRKRFLELEKRTKMPPAPNEKPD
jgi:L-lactate dehydrogenase complex protein LldF